MARKPIINDWRFGTFFGQPAVAGYDEDGRRIMRPQHFISGGTVGLYSDGKRSEVFRLGRPGPGEPPWMAHEAHRAYLKARGPRQRRILTA